MSAGPKSTAFDDLILPHLTAIKELCIAHKINFAAYFALDEVMKNCILQSRMAKINDEDDLAGIQCVLKIWEAIKDGEEEFEERMPMGKENN